MKIFFKINLITLFLLNSIATFANNTEPIDVLFVCHSKDLRTLDLAIHGAKQNCLGAKRVIVVSNQELTKQAEWFDESLYPFNKLDLALEIFRGDLEQAQNFIKSPNSRIGWIYQQLLKLYAPFVIPGLADHMLVVDADTIFLNPVRFIDQNNLTLLNYGTEYHKPYFEHAEKLLPGFKKVYPRISGICHHMLMQRSILELLFNKITTIHQTDPWRAICRCINHHELQGASFSEYEIYFNFILSLPNQAKLRPLRWTNTPFEPQKIAYLQKTGCHYASFHEHLQTPKTLSNRAKRR